MFLDNLGGDCSFTLFSIQFTAGWRLTTWMLLAMASVVFWCGLVLGAFIGRKTVL